MRSARFALKSRMRIFARRGDDGRVSTARAHSLRQLDTEFEALFGRLAKGAL